MDLIGRSRVVMPITKEDFDKNVGESLKLYFSKAVSTHDENVKQIERIHNQYLGKQDILEKIRVSKSDINNKNVENHLFKQVNFKVGFMYGNPVEYTISNNKKIDSDDMTYLNAYFTDCSKASKDIEKAQDLYEFGIAYQRLIPKRTQIEDYESEAPFELENMDVKNTFLVYSNDTPPIPLFGCVKASQDNPTNKILKDTYYQIYMPFKKYDIEDGTFKILREFDQPYNYIPIEEFTLNKDRVGIIEIVLLMQNTLNRINSLQLDGMEEVVNSFLVIFNQKVDDEDFLDTFKKLMKERIIALNTNDPQRPADIKNVSIDGDQVSANEFYERIKKAMYDIVAVPQASGNVTSGGDTGQARLLGNGWESAQNQAKVDQTYLTQFERKLLKDILWICNHTAKCPIKEIKASDIAIKYNINMSDNLYVKAESLKMLNDIMFPEKQALSIVGLTNDVDGVGDAWKKNKESAKAQSVENQPNDNLGNNLQ